MIKESLPGSQDRLGTYRRAFIVMLSVLVIALTAFKSATTSFTHDESFTYGWFVHQSFMDIVSYVTPYTNNHILNTLFMKVSEICFGPAEWALRLHSILALAVYLFFGGRIVHMLPVRLQIPCFLLLVANPYLIDFFGLARGYGLAIGFMMMAVYYILKALRNKSISSLLLFHIAAMLAAFSNFALINFYLGALCSFYLVHMLETRYSAAKIPGERPLLKVSIISFLFVLATTLILWEPLRKTREAGVLDFGGKNGFVADTVSSVIAASLYHMRVGKEWVYGISWMAAACVVLTCIYWINALLRDAETIARLKYLVFVNCTLIVVAMATIAQHFIMNNDYFIGRFALFLFPLFVLNLLFWWKDLYERQVFKNGLMYVTVSLAVLAGISTLYNANLLSYLDWEYDQDTQKVMIALKNHHAHNNPGDTVQLGVYWHFEPTVNFYRVTWKLGWLKEVYRQDLLESDNYFYTFRGAGNNYQYRRDTLFQSATSPYWLVYNLPPH